MIQLGLMLLGFIAAAYGTIVGAGGGFLVVPMLLLLFSITPEAAAATGLAVVALNAISGMPILIKQRRVLSRTGLWLSLGAAPGTFLGAFLVRFVSESFFYGIFACLLIGLGLFLIFNKKKETDSQATAELAVTDESVVAPNPENPGSFLQLLFIGFLLGVVSSFFGIGGGWLLVPIMVYVLGISIKTATATSMFSLAIYSLIGLIPSLQDSIIDWQIVLWAGFGVVVGAQVGAIVSKKMKGTTITRLLSILVIVLGLHMFVEIL